jgi:hypothetical protein
MPYYKKIKQLCCLYLLALFFAGALPANASSSSLVIKEAEISAADESYILNADVDIKFNAEIEQAISKGFELNFLVEFQLLSPRKYWFDDEIVTVTHRIVLSYHALSRQYLLIRGDQQKVFATLDEAKQALSEIRDLKVFQKSDLEKGEVYKAILLMRLDYTKMSKALQVDAMGSDDWKVASPRFEWQPNLMKVEVGK